MTQTPALNDSSFLPDVDPMFEHYLVDEPRLTYESPDDGPLTRAFVRLLEGFLGRQKMEAHYQNLKGRKTDAKTFFREAFKLTNITIDGDMSPIANIPKNRPVLFIANHPFGVIDGLIMCNLALDYADDFQVVINSLLCQDRDLVPHFLPIDFSETKEAAKRNVRTKQLAGKALDNGVPLILFPSGMVSTAGAPGFGNVVDAPWTTFIAKLVMQYQPTVVPVFFHGQNTRLFHVASNIAEPLRMAMHMREALRRFGSNVSLDVGRHHSPEDYSHISSRQEMTEHFYNIVQQTRQPRMSRKGRESRKGRGSGKRSQSQHQ
ncbi:MAG: lysophospholipid acyltransferase family protein [Pseudomonadales bacterium]|nr:lysophospholipid acyltransferase family protein [Pseudomonadales bacterium]